MNSIHKLINIVCLFLAISTCSITNAQIALKAGFARVPITPTIEDRWYDTNNNARYDDDEPWEDNNNNGVFDAVYLAGFHQNRIAQGVHDDIYASATVLEHGARRVALVSVDTIGFMFEELQDLRAQLPKAMAIDLVISHATHNHEAPDTQGLWGPNKLNTGVNPDYMQFVKAQMRTAIVSAFENRTAVTISGAHIHSDSDLDVEDTRFPQVRDQGIRYLVFRREDTGAVIGSWVNWSNHVETLWSKNLLITSDYVHYLRAGIEGGIRYDQETHVKGLGGIMVFFAGNVGGLMTTSPRVTVQDIFTGKSYKEPSFLKAQAQGYKLAKYILDSIRQNEAKTLTSDRFKFASKQILLSVDNLNFRLADWVGLIRRDISLRGYTQSEVSILRVGEFTLLTIPGELYPQLAVGGVSNPPGADYFHPQSTKQRPLYAMLPGSLKMLINLGNDSIGYIIPKSEWDSDKPWLMLGKSTYGEENSMGPETANTIYQAVKDLLEQVQFDH